jgi:hypothetical protein
LMEQLGSLLVKCLFKLSETRTIGSELEVLETQGTL